LPENRRNKIHAFSCLFYAKLLEENHHEAQHQLVSRWTKNVDLFSLDFILFPINLRHHWSLIVMARPQLWIEAMEKRGKYLPIL
jgi:Ulp1 family protease